MRVFDRSGGATTTERKTPSSAGNQAAFNHCRASGAGAYLRIRR